MTLGVGAGLSHVAPLPAAWSSELVPPAQRLAGKARFCLDKLGARERASHK